MGVIERWQLWAAVAVLLFWSVGAYNRLVRLRAQALQAFQPLDARLAQCIVLLREHSPLAGGEDKPWRTQPLLAHSGPWASLQAACTQFDVALRLSRRQVLDAESIGALRAAHATLHDGWLRLVGECAAYPGLLPVSWRTAWEDNRRLVQDAAQGFNQAVAEYNAAIGQFPALLLARVVGFRPAGCL